MAEQYCETYRGWMIWFEPDGGYLTSPGKTFPKEGYFSSREEARQNIDLYRDQPENFRDIPEDKPSLGDPWWKYP